MAVHKDDVLGVGFARSRLVQNFSFLCADLEAELHASLGMNLGILAGHYTIMEFVHYADELVLTPKLDHQLP